VLVATKKWSFWGFLTHGECSMKYSQPPNHPFWESRILSGNTWHEISDLSLWFHWHFYAPALSDVADVVLNLGPFKPHQEIPHNFSGVSALSSNLHLHSLFHFAKRHRFAIFPSFSSHLFYGPYFCVKI